MAQPQVQEMGSLKALKAHIKKRSGGGTYFQYVPAEGITVRFLTEPDKWVAYDECWNQTTKKSFPYADGLVEGVDYTRKGTKYLATAVVVSAGRNQDKAVPFQMPQSVVNSLVNRYEKVGTILDRNYEIDKNGTGLDTEYYVTPEAPSKFNMTKHEVLDLPALVAKAYNEAFGVTTDDDDDTDDEPVKAGKPRKQKKGMTKEGTKKKKTKPPVDDDDEEDDDEDEVPTAVEMESMEWSDLKALGIKHGVDVKKHKNRKTLIPAISKASF